MTGDRNDWRDTILSMESSIAQRYCFARYVLRECRLDAAAIAGSFQADHMDEREYDFIAARWST